jgi:uncharacterized repeat protein (TIGR01451 family)
LSLTKTVNTASPVVGGNVTFTITVSNAAGFSQATGVTVKDVLPAGLTFVSSSAGPAYVSSTGIWTVGTLNAGAAANLTITATVTTTGTKTNLAQVQTAGLPDVDSTPGNAPTVHEDDDASVSVTPSAPASLGDKVFEDCNGNGLFDSLTDKGLANVTVRLYTSAGVLVSTTTSNSSGIYSFSGLAPGNYYVQFELPSGYVFTPANIGADDAKDSDADVSTGKTGTISVAAGSSSTVWDAGMYKPASLSGFVYNDVNDSGVKDASEAGIQNVTLTLTGTTGTGQSVTKTTVTSASGAYTFIGLQPGTYTITETQPPTTADGKDTLGNVYAGATNLGVKGSASTNDVFSGIPLQCGNSGINYNFGEFQVFKGQTATIGFWHNQNGQALIKSFTTTSTGATLANWLATTMPDLFGKNAPKFSATAKTGVNLSGRSNAEVASYFLSLFAVTGQKTYAQVLATAFSVFTTTNSLNTGTTGKSLASRYGFILSAGGAGAFTYNVGGNGAAFGLPNNTTTTILDLLVRASKNSVKGILNNGNQTYMNMTNGVFDAINNKGDIK